MPISPHAAILRNSIESNESAGMHDKGHFVAIFYCLDPPHNDGVIPAGVKVFDLATTNT